jgi:predicted transcriptional regulator YheO
MSVTISRIKTHCQEETDGLLCINGHLDILGHMKSSFDKFKLQHLCRKKSYPLQVWRFKPLEMPVPS